MPPPCLLLQNCCGPNENSGAAENDFSRPILMDAMVAVLGKFQIWGVK